MDHLLEVVSYVRALQVNPLAGVIVAGLLAALIEQRVARRRTADFTSVYRDGPPQEPPPKAFKSLKPPSRR